MRNLVVLIHKLKVILLVLVLAGSTFVASEIEEVIVITKKIDSLKGWSNNLGVVSIEGSDLDKLDAQHPKQTFRRIPGVWISRGSGQEHLTAIRSPVLTGPGACGSFLILEDGLPIRPSGFCNINGLFETSMELASQVEVIRGPASARYGANAMHGVINVLSESLSSTNSISTNVGPSGYKNVKTSLGRAENWKFNVALSSTDGFREHSGYDQQKVQFKQKVGIGSWEGSFNLTATNLNQETAGYVSGLDSYKDKSLNRRNLNPESYRDASSFRSNLKLVKEIKNGLLILNPYLRSNEMEFFQHYLPGTPFEENQHDSFGIVLQDIRNLNGYSLVRGFSLESTKAGLKETQRNPLTTSSSFNNATRPQGKHYDYEVDAKAYAGFIGIENYSINSNLKGFADARIESLKYSYGNKMLDGNTRADGTKCGFGGCYYNRPSDRSDSYEDVSFRLGIETFNKDVNYFSQISLGFRPPQINEAYRLQKKQTVSDLDSENLVMFEVGSRFALKNINGTLSLYKSKKTNSIFRESENFIVDNGKTNHTGVELLAETILNDKNTVSLALTYGDHKYDFTSGTSTRERISQGNVVDTAPKIMGNVLWLHAVNERFNLEFEIEHMGSYFTDAANLHEYEGHTLLHARADLTVSPRSRLFIRVENLNDKDYAERADFNAFGGDRYFPGLPREAYIGLEYDL
jgi:outer membrane cobalamin receptor